MNFVIEVELVLLLNKALD